MVTRIYPKRYAQAIFEIAREEKDIDKWQADLQQLERLSTDAVLLTLLASPKLAFVEKVKLLDEQIKGINPLARNLVYLLAEKNKVHWISEIAEAYHQIVDKYHGIQHAVVKTATQLDEAEKAKLETTLNTITGTKVILKTEVDPSLVGGMVARIGGKLLDGSIHSKLLTLKKELAGRER